MGTITKGPWVFLGEYDAVVVLKDGYVRAVADFGKVSLPLDEIEANARLIAAAPDLLGALEEIAKSYPITEEAQALADIARAALLKI